MKNITILTVSFRSGVLLNRLFNNIIDKANNPNMLKFLIIDNTDGDDKDLKKHFKSNYDINFLENHGAGLQRSISHANALDLGLKNLKTEFCLIIDPDVHIFQSGWDTFCVNILKKEKRAVVGAPYPKWKLGKVHDYPSVIFMFFNTKHIQNLNKTFYPFPKNLKRMINTILRKITRLGMIATKRRLDNKKTLRDFAEKLETILGVTSPDTGNQMIDCFRHEGYKAINFESKYSNELKSNVNKAVFRLAEEYELYYHDGKPMITHMYGSGVFYWKTDRGSDFKYWQELIKSIEKKLL